MASYVIVKIEERRGKDYSGLGIVRAMSEDSKKAYNEILLKMYGVAFVPVRDVKPTTLLRKVTNK